MSEIQDEFKNTLKTSQARRGMAQVDSLLKEMYCAIGQHLGEVLKRLALTPAQVARAAAEAYGDFNTIDEDEIINVLSGDSEDMTLELLVKLASLLKESFIATVSSDEYAAAAQNLEPELPSSFSYSFPAGNEGILDKMFSDNTGRPSGRKPIFSGNLAGLYDFVAQNCTCANCTARRAAGQTGQASTCGPTPVSPPARKFANGEQVCYLFKHDNENPEKRNAAVTGAWYGNLKGEGESETWNYYLHGHNSSFYFWTEEELTKG